MQPKDGHVHVYVHVHVRTCDRHLLSSHYLLSSGGSDDVEVTLKLLPRVTAQQFILVVDRGESVP